MVRIQAFGRRYPEYAATAILDDLRASEYGRLDRLNQIYLDYTGGGLWADSQVDEHAALLRSEVFGNPHSASVSSSATTRLVERTRRHVLDYFNASGTYTAIFTANATAALKLVGEAFPFAPGGRLLMTADNHNSVNGIREFASARGALIGYAPITAPELRLDRPALDRLLTGKADGTARLFAFPAQSNFSGVKHPLDIVDVAKARGWRVLLDAAAFVPTNRLDLAAVQPDFVTLSFYKMFGYPTGVGCLLVHHDAMPLLHRPWFAGGTVNFASVQGRLHVLSPGEAGFEDGTLNYLSIPAVDIGLRHLERIGIECIQTRVRCLTAWLLDELMALRHSTGKPMVRLYGPATTEARGGTIAFNLYDPDGHLLDYRRVEELAGVEGISIRTGCFCNPGAGETAEGLTEEDMLAGAALGDDISLAQFRDIVLTRGGKSAGAMRVSFGIASNFADAARFLDFVAGFRDQTRLTIGAVTFDIESCRVIRDGS
jgi:selenocysteine lyase/cysteine desulfurase